MLAPWGSRRRWGGSPTCFWICIAASPPNVDEQPAVHLPINQTHIADATGLTPVHVCRTLKHMRLDKLLDFHKGQLVLFDPCRLAEIAQLDPEVQLDHPAPVPGLSLLTPRAPMRSATG